MDMTLTDAIYRASKDPRIPALADIADIDARNTAAAALDKEGLIIDRAIDIWLWDPTKVMAYRQHLGYPWLPNAFQPDLINPFKLIMGPSTDMSVPWERSIKVSTDANDYPPFHVTPPFVPSSSPIGPKNGELFSVNLAAVAVNGKFMFVDGEEYVENGVTYIFHNVPGMFGPMLSWTLK